MIFKYPGLYLEFLKQSIKTILEYRADFIIGTIASFIKQLVGLLFVWLIFQNIGHIKGWGFYEVAFVYGLLTLAKSCCGIFFGELWSVGNYVRLGDFDRFLLRPVPPLFYLFANKIHLTDLGEMIIGLMIVIKSMAELHLRFGFPEMLVLILFLFSGTLIFAAINLLIATLSFIIVDSQQLMWAVLSVSDFALYPISIFPKGIIFIITWIIPYAFISIYPANFFLDKGFQTFSWLSPVIALILVIISLQVWKLGIRRYTGTGS